jgi:hypothetical protein
MRPGSRLLDERRCRSAAAFISFAGLVLFIGSVLRDDQGHVGKPAVLYGTCSSTLWALSSPACCISHDFFVKCMLGTFLCLHG